MFYDREYIEQVKRGNSEKKIKIKIQNLFKISQKKYKNRTKNNRK